MNANRDDQVIDGFGDEWSRFDQAALSDDERQRIFDSYFAIFPWSDLPPEATGADFGCGSGRWAAVVAPKVGHLTCVDPSDRALAVARSNLAEMPNVDFVNEDVESMTLPLQSLDFGYSLGVLHHIPDTQAAMRACVARLKPGAPFLVYLYYDLDNRPGWYRLLWRCSNGLRRVVSRLPYSLRSGLSEAMALVVYWPLARAAKLLELAGANVNGFPLAFYRNRSLYVMRNDALDRFGTRLEQRFTKDQISTFMAECGLTSVRFSDAAPYWCAVGIRSLTAGR